MGRSRYGITDLENHAPLPSGCSIGKKPTKATEPSNLGKKTARRTYSRQGNDARKIDYIHQITNPLKPGYIDEAVRWHCILQIRNYAGKQGLLEVCAKW